MHGAREIRYRDDDGQASVELIALIPALVAIGVLAWQLLLAGETWWLASTAARSAARADALGADARSAALSSLPSNLRSGVRVESVDAGGIRLHVGIPAALPGLHLGSVTAAASMEPQQ
jgi:hypothetical protein